MPRDITQSFCIIIQQDDFDTMVNIDLFPSGPSMNMYATEEDSPLVGKAYSIKETKRFFEEARECGCGWCFSCVLRECFIEELAGATGIVEGYAATESPLTDGEKQQKKKSNLPKKIPASVRAPHLKLIKRKVTIEEEGTDTPPSES